MTFLTDEELSTSWATPNRIARKLADCLCKILACSLGGLPVLAKDCADRALADGETGVCKMIGLGPGIETICCGAVIVQVDRFWAHDGLLREVRDATTMFDTERLPNGAVSLCGERRDPSWAIDVSVAVLRCTPDRGGKIDQPAQMDPGLTSDYAAILQSDAMAMMLLAECCFDESTEGNAYDEVVAGYGPNGNSDERIKGDLTRKVGPIWIPGNTKRLHPMDCCRANVMGFNYSSPLQIHIPNDKLPCLSDCIALGVG